jgi:hypothetical protein
MHRTRKGSAITEFGPALFVFLIIIFFPLMDLLGMAAVYCCGWYCNFLVTREVAVRTQAQGQLAAQEVDDEFLKTGVAAFVGLKAGDHGSKIVHVLNYNTAAAGLPPQVECKTSITGVPFLTIPFIPAVPGLSAPITFTMTQVRPREVQN